MAVKTHQHKMTRLGFDAEGKYLYCEVDGCDVTERVAPPPQAEHPKDPPARERPGAPQTPGAPKPQAPRRAPTPPPVVERPVQVDDDDDL